MAKKSSAKKSAKKPAKKIAKKVAKKAKGGKKVAPKKAIGYSTLKSTGSFTFPGFAKFVSKKSKKASKKASKGMTKTAIIMKVAEKCAVKTREVKDILDSFTTAGYAELKKTG
eukprot:gene33523-38034_t